MPRKYENSAASPVQMERGSSDPSATSVTSSSSLKGLSYEAGVKHLNPDVQFQIARNGLTDPGQKLPEAHAIGRSLGADLDHVQMHTGARAQAACSALGAEGFTLGQNVAFKSPSPSFGLQAHEAAHTVQQRAGGESVQLKGESSAASDKGETEADKAAKKAAEEKEAARVKKAEASWEKLFGETVGGWLFSQIRDHLSPADLLGYGKQGTEAMADAAGSLFSTTDGLGGMLDEEKEVEALNKFMGAIAPKLKELTDQWLASKSGTKVLTAISQWTEESPGAMTAIAASIGAAAIGAAVAAYCANVDPPNFEKMFKLGKSGLSVGGAIDLGPVQQLAVQAATLAMKYERGNFKIEVSASKDKEGDYSGAISVSDKRKLGESTNLSSSGKAKIKEDGTVELEIDGGVETLIAGTPLELSLGGKGTAKAGVTKVEGSLVIGDEKGAHQELKGEYDPTTGSFKIRREASADGVSSYEETARNSDGEITQTTGAKFKGPGVKGSVENIVGPSGESNQASLYGTNIGGSGFDLGGTVGSGSKEGLSIDLGYRRGIFSTELDLAFKPGLSTITHKSDIKTNDGVKAGYNFDINLTESQLSEFGMYFGYDDPDHFRGFLFKYKSSYLAEEGMRSDEFDLKLEQTLGKAALRLEGTAGFRNGGFHNAGADLTVGYPIGSDLMVLGGVGYHATQSPDGMMHDPTIGAGLQYKDVGLMLNYHPMHDGDGMLSLGVVIPLGRRKK